MFYDNSTGAIMMAAYNLSNSMCEVRTVDVTTGNTTIVSTGSGVEITAATLPITGGGGGTPPGLIGYNIYRDGDFIWYIEIPISLSIMTSTLIRIPTNMMSRPFMT